MLPFLFYSTRAQIFHSLRQRLQHRGFLDIINAYTVGTPLLQSEQSFPKKTVLHGEDCNIEVARKNARTADLVLFRGMTSLSARL